MNLVSADNSIFKFSKANNPVLRVKSGESVQIETLDCFSNQLKSDRDTLEAIDWEKINPASGPIYIEGATPGDVLKVTIEEIRLSEKGVMTAGDGLSITGDLINGIEVRIVPIENDRVIFNSKVSIPLNPMIGVIGVAPEYEEVNCGTPGSHGGNMDNLMITTDAVLYLPVFVEGALFALGDLHAAMGDGEIGGTGIEVPGRVTVKLEIIKDLKINNPVLENQRFFTTIASQLNLEDAVKESVKDMLLILKDRISEPLSELTMLMSMVGQTQICQVVDPLKTARFVMPKYILDKYNFSL